MNKASLLYNINLGIEEQKRTLKEDRHTEGFKENSKGYIAGLEFAKVLILTKDRDQKEFN